MVKNNHKRNLSSSSLAKSNPYKKNHVQTTILFGNGHGDTRRNPFKSENDSIKRIETEISDKYEFSQIYVGGIRIQFPFNRPYPSQLHIMATLIKCMSEKTNGTFESPTGTGKSLIILTSSISWLLEKKESRKTIMQKRKSFTLELALENENKALDKIEYSPNGLTEKKSESKKFEITEADYPVELQNPDHVPKVFIASRTQRQIAQMIKELKNKTLLQPKMSVLGSRDHLCIHPDVKKKVDKNEACSILVKENKCSFFENSRLLSTKLRDVKLVFDIEDLVKKGIEHNACPYYASRNLTSSADVIFAPYNYVIDPAVRNASSINLKNNILIIDEAHNVEQTAVDAASPVFFESELENLVLDLQSFKSHQKDSDIELEIESCAHLAESLVHWAKEKLSKCLSNGNTDFRVYDGAECSKILLASGLAKERIPIIKATMEGCDIDLKTRCIMEKMLLVFDLIISKERSEDFRMVVKKILKSAEPKFQLEFWCLNPGVIFEQIGKDCRSVILTSGTLSPLASYQLELGIPFSHSIEAPHVIPKEQIWAGAVATGVSGNDLLCNYENLNNPLFQDDIGRTIVRILKNCPNGVLCFFPSYNRLENLTIRWRKTGIWAEMADHKSLFVEPSSGGSGEDGIEKEMQKFTKLSCSGRGAIMFCVYRGKMSEGMDFSDERARAVICLGIPFPDINNPNMKEMMNYRKINKKLMSSAEWYKTLAFRALNQALGRVIRHQNDFGAIILLDYRYSKRSNINFLPSWLQKFICVPPTIEEVEGQLKGFFAKAIAESEGRKEKANLIKEQKKIPALAEASDEACAVDDKIDPATNSNTTRWACLRCDNEFFDKCHGTMKMVDRERFNPKSKIGSSDGEIVDAGYFKDSKSFLVTSRIQCFRDNIVFETLECSNCESEVGFHILNMNGLESNRVWLLTNENITVIE